MEKLLRVAEMRDLEKQVTKGEISYSRMVEIINEKHFMELVKLRGELQNVKNLKNTVVLNGIEFGYKQCEMGNSLEECMANVH